MFYIPSYQTNSAFLGLGVKEITRTQALFAIRRFDVKKVPRELAFKVGDPNGIIQCKKRTKKTQVEAYNSNAHAMLKMTLRGNNQRLCSSDQSCNGRGMTTEQ